MSATATHYLNSDFDLRLRPRPRQVRQERLVRQVRELSIQALLGAGPDDCALLRADVPQEFVDHLAGCGLPVPRLLRHPDVDPAGRLRPFGWSDEAIELNRLHRLPAAHPSLSCIRRVNSRSFARQLEERLAGGCPGHVVDGVAALEALLARESETAEWVVKAEHGNAGLANRRVRRSGLTAADRRFVDDRLAEDDRLVVEPWLPRERDWCVVFEVPFDGAALRVHEQVCTRDGALIGALFDPAPGVSNPWTGQLTETAREIAPALEAEGYFGPVCLDAFEWRDGDRKRLRPLVDLNCRRSMSDGAQRLWRRVAPDRVLYYRFFSRRKLSLPGELAQALAALDPHRYDPDERRGVLLASPLHLADGPKNWSPGKLAVIFVADERPGIFELERWFRERFEG